MNTLLIVFAIIQIAIGINLLNPFLLFILSFFTKKDSFSLESSSNYDYAIIVTAYKQTDLLPSVVNSILKLKYENYLIYVVADNCDITNLHFDSEKVVLLRPEEILSSNIRSHQYAISHFKRDHDYLTIIDSDNLVDPHYLSSLNAYFDQGYLAVQGVRTAKNLNTNYACLDEAGDMYYRFTDRKVMYDLGSSASLAGSGMAFLSSFYVDCLSQINIEGAGFDKLLQMEILDRGKRIAFAEGAIVYDEKTADSKQLVNQRARWISAYFKNLSKGLNLILKGLTNLNWNQFICGVVFSKPPLFMVVGFTMVSVLFDIFFMPTMLIFWLVAISSFLFIFLYSLYYFKATKSIYMALTRIPYFIFFQVISLFKAKRANEISTATVHSYNSEIDKVTHLKK